MKNEKAISRSYQNQKNEVIESDIQKSGFNMTYRNHLGGLVLGRLYPQSIQHCMPNDKISGSNECNLTFERLATPVVDTMDICTHNFLVTKRSIDNRFEKFMTPTKLNNMNLGVSVPTFDFHQIIVSVFVRCLGFISTYSTSTPSAPKLQADFTILRSRLSGIWDDVYHSDSLVDLLNQIEPFFSANTFRVFDLTDPTDAEAAKQILYIICDFFLGKRSLFDYLGYFIVSHNDVDSLLDNIYINPTWMGYFDYSNLGEVTLDEILLDSQDLVQDTSVFTRRVYKLQNEYALRAYYAIWFEYYRNYDLEPRSANLPEYHDFGATSIFGTYSFSDLHYIVPRIRSWQADAFTTAGIDDISRHVFAPILSTGNNLINADPDTDLQPTGIIDNTVRMQTISWRDPKSGVVSSVAVPMPERLISALQVAPTALPQATQGLELFSLRKAQMLENYLKRIYYGGDEYRDRMLHIYGSKIEDYRINRPQWLSSSIDTVSPRQEVANTGVSPTNSDPDQFPIGSRVATATGAMSGNDGFTEFCPEFAVYISMLSVMPHASYDPYILQNLETNYSDFPIPQFANQMEDVISTLEISRSSMHRAFGYAPYGHAYRYRVDEIHGDYHDEKYDYCFLRFFDDKNIPNLSWSFIHCRPKLPMFVNSILMDGQCYGTFKHNFLVERPLPSPVEVI